MSQMTFSDYEYCLRKRKTKREEYLEIMDEIIPWEEWGAFMRPYYPDGRRGRPTKGIEKMLRMYLLQVWFNLSDEGVEDAIYDSYAFRKFMKIDFTEEQVSDATTLLKFRHLLERNHLGEVFFAAIKRVMDESEHIMHGGTIVDATIIEAPSSTKNAEKQRDPEMHQAKKGNTWHFGMKCHIGVYAGSGLIHTVTETSANTADITEAHKLLREDDGFVYGDNGYAGIAKRDEIKNNEKLSKIDFRINRRPKSLPKLPDGMIDWEREIEHQKSAVRCKIEHPFQILKNMFHFRKVRYKGLAKNLNKLNVLVACVNFLMVKQGEMNGQKLRAKG